MEYFSLLALICYLTLCIYSYKVLKSPLVTKQGLFKMAVSWGVVLTLFAIFSGIFLLVAAFSIITQEWENTFLLNKTPVFIATFVSYKIFVQFKKGYKQRN